VLPIFPAVQVTKRKKGRISGDDGVTSHDHRRQKALVEVVKVEAMLLLRIRRDVHLELEMAGMANGTKLSAEIGFVGAEQRATPERLLELNAFGAKLCKAPAGEKRPLHPDARPGIATMCGDAKPVRVVWRGGIGVLATVNPDLKTSDLQRRITEISLVITKPHAKVG